MKPLLKIEVHGQKKAVAKAAKLLKKNLEEMDEPKARLQLQDLIDDNNVKATIMVNGNYVWSKKRILQNLKRIMDHGRLYGERTPGRHLVAGVLWLPVNTDPVLSKYFYEFLTDCGSAAHYSIHGWIAEYPTLEHLKKFFKKNEFGQRVLDYIPDWMTDAKRIVEAIEIQLYPLESYMRARRK